MEGVQLFHAGTAARNGEVVTAAGRVLAVSARGDGFGAARRRAYAAAEIIAFEGKHVRTDVAQRAESAVEASL
jgi:phosphoribosylamine--glycine ligase